MTRISETTRSLFNRILKEAELEMPGWWDKHFDRPHSVSNEPGNLTIGLRPQIDHFIDASIHEGLQPEEIAEKILTHPHWKKWAKCNDVDDFANYVRTRMYRMANGEVLGNHESWPDK